MNKKLLVFLVPLISVIAIFGIFAMLNQPIVQPIVISQGIDFESGAHISVIRADGDIEDLGWSHNVYTNAGKNATRDAIFRQIYYGNFTYIGLCNASAGCTAAATDSSIDNEYVNSGLLRAAGVVSVVGNSPGNVTIYKEFTATENNLRVNMTGLLNQSTGGTLIAVVEFTDTTLQNNDKLAVNWTGNFV